MRSIGEDPHLFAARRQGVGETGHQYLDTADVGAETLGRDDDQALKAFLSAARRFDACLSENRLGPSPSS
jgi:hypothetical protein